MLAKATIHGYWNCQGLGLVMGVRDLDHGTGCRTRKDGGDITRCPHRPATTTNRWPYRTITRLSVAKLREVPLDAASYVL